MGGWGLFEDFLKDLLSVGQLTVRLPNGGVHTYGDGTGPEVQVRLDARGIRQILANPDLGMGEAYMDGHAVIEQGDIWQLLEIVGRNQQLRPYEAPGLFKQASISVRRWLEQNNDRRAARRNASHHYDLSFDLYRRFLDRDLQYSCAYFFHPDMTLEEAQAAKKAHIAAKLRLKPGMKVLEIGCGWGGLALELARTFDVEVLGISLSKEQVSVANQRAEAAGLNDRVKFQLIDFRDVTGSYDRVVSIAMFEAVGAPNFDRYFRDIRRLLTDDGVALVHSIGRRTPPSTTSPWTRKYIFPGGYIPALSETMASIEKTPFWVTDIEILRLHYAETLRHWRLRFWAEREAIAKVYDERFCRMWEYYLAGAEMAFRYGDQMIFQIQLAKQRTALPITRDYMVEDERASPGSAFAHVRAAE